MLFVRWFLFLLCVLALLNLLPEPFTELGGLPLYALKVSLPKVRYRIDIQDHNIDLSPWLKDTYNLLQTRSSRVRDAYVADAYFFPKEDQVITILPMENALLFIKEKSPVGYETLADALTRSATIGYTSPESLELTKIILAANDVDVQQVRFQRVPRMEEGASAGLAFIAVYDLWKDLSILLSGLALDFVTYENTDIHKLKVWIPFAKMKDEDMSIHFPSYKDRFPVKKCLVIDLLVATESDTHRLFDKELHSFIQATGLMDTNNYYNQFFKFTRTSEAYLATYNRYIHTRANLSILEQFQETHSSVPLLASYNVDGYYDAAKHMFYMFETHVQGIPLQKGQIVHFAQQERDEEQGTYQVQDVGRGAVLKRVGKEPSSPTQDDPFDTRYRCVGDLYNRNRGLCESDRDETGQIKAKRTVWDRPCETNLECPFYQANKNYPNYRGGCNDGYCEFPLGVQRLSFRTFDPNTKPICHHCPVENPRCCELQRTDKKYKQFRSPDYAFENDSYERMYHSRVEKYAIG